MSTREYHFALLIAGLDVNNDDQVTAFYTHSLHDAVLEDRGGQAMATFYREANSPEAAVNSAIEDVEQAVPGACVLRVDDQLVNATDIGELTCRTSENIRQFASGTRGPGGFPAPAGIVGKGARVWRWAEVRPWLAAHGVANEAETLPTGLIALTNARLAETRTP